MFSNENTRRVVEDSRCNTREVPIDNTKGKCMRVSVGRSNTQERFGFARLVGAVAGREQTRRGPDPTPAATSVDVNRPFQPQRICCEVLPRRGCDVPRSLCVIAQSKIIIGSPYNMCEPRCYTERIPIYTREGHLRSQLWIAVPPVPIFPGPRSQTLCLIDVISTRSDALVGQIKIFNGPNIILN